VDKNLFICHIDKLLITQKRIVLLTPPLAEKENGFDTWVQKIAKLSQELSIPIVHFGRENTYDIIVSKIKDKRLNTPVRFNTFNEWDNFMVLSKQIKGDDLLVLVSARKNSVSYLNHLDKIPAKLERDFRSNNKILIIPQQYNQFYERREDLSTSPLVKGIEAIGSIGRGISNIFINKN
jgi:hypothetical protein